MSQNPFEPPTTRLPKSKRLARLAANRLVIVIANSVLCVLGFAFAALSLIPSDAPEFFLYTGVHLIGCGTSGFLSGLVKRPMALSVALRSLSFVANLTLVARLLVLVFAGTVRGPLAIAAPVLIGVPALLNVVTAVVRRSVRSA